MMLDVGSSVGASSTTSVWHAVGNRPYWWVDLIIFGVPMLVQILAYLSKPDASPNPAAAAESLRGAATGGLTVVGILLPLSILAVQLRAGGSSTQLSANSLADFFMASVWLFLSLTCGLYVLFSAAIRGPREDVVRNRDIGLLFGAQLFFLFVSCFRLLWAISSVITTLLPTSK